MDTHLQGQTRAPSPKDVRRGGIARKLIFHLKHQDEESVAPSLRGTKTSHRLFRVSKEAFWSKKRRKEDAAGTVELDSKVAEQEGKRETDGGG